MLCVSKRLVVAAAASATVLTGCYVVPLNPDGTPAYPYPYAYNTPPYAGVPVSPGGPVHFAAHFGSLYGGPPQQGAHLSVREGNREFVTDVPPETVDRWKVALSEALESTGLSETARGPLLELRAILSLEEFPRRGPGSADQ